MATGLRTSRLAQLLAAAAHGALVAGQFPNPRAMRGQALGQGVAWGGQNFTSPEALVAWINAHGGHTNVAQFEHNHPGAFGHPVDYGPGALQHAPGVKPPMPMPGPFDGGPPSQDGASGLTPYLGAPPQPDLRAWRAGASPLGPPVPAPQPPGGGGPRVAALDQFEQNHPGVAVPLPAPGAPVLAALIAHHLSRPRPRSVRRPLPRSVRRSGALSY